MHEVEAIKSDGEPISVLMEDQQIDLASGQRFFRSVKTLHNAEAVRVCSKFEATFDPVTDYLAVHHLIIHRNGQTISLLENGGEFQLLQRETNLELQVFDGSLSAVMLIHDVRIGDTLDFCFSRISRWELIPGKHSLRLDLARSYKVARFYLTVLTQPGNSLQWKALGGAKALSSRVTESAICYECAIRNLAPFEIEPVTHPWHVQSPELQCSNFSSWEEVGQSLHQLWEHATAMESESPALTEAVESIRVPEHSLEVQVDSAIWFVQNEIRYQAISIGNGRMIPSNPAVVLQRRFGDCKDKTVLLNYLLHALGVPAVPVLVDSTKGPALSQFLPSFAAFDHVICSYWLENQRYYVDPTVTGQGGRAKTRYLPDYGHALEVSATSQGLMPLGPSGYDAARVEISQKVKIHGSGAADLEVITAAHGLEADQIRSQLNIQGKEGVIQELRSQVDNRYDNVKPLGTPTISDNLPQNVLTISATYRIEDITFKPKPGVRMFAVSTLDILPRLLPIPPDVERKSPIALIHPTHVIERIAITTPWAVARREEVKVRGPGFEFDYTCAPQGKLANLSFEYRTTRDHLSPWQIPEYVRKMEQLITAYVIDPSNLVSPDADSTSKGSNAGPFLLFAAVGLLTAGFYLKDAAFLKKIPINAPQAQETTAPQAQKQLLAEKTKPLVPMRWWTDARGNRIEAELTLVRLNADKRYEGTFVSKDGTSRVVIIGSLCREDVELVRETMKSKNLLSP